MKTSRCGCSAHPAYIPVLPPASLTTLALTGCRPSVMPPAHTACLISLSFYLKSTHSFIPHVEYLPWAVHCSQHRGLHGEHDVVLPTLFLSPRLPWKHLKTGHSLCIFKLSTAPSPVHHSANTWWFRRGKWRTACQRHFKGVCLCEIGQKNG